MARVECRPIPLDRSVRIPPVFEVRARQDDHVSNRLDHDRCYAALTSRDRRFDGRFWVGVRTTGVYCRPVCPSRTPRSGNVDFYAHPAAAEDAGFRPCKRCQPDAVPGTTAWDEQGALVDRALALLSRRLFPWAHLSGEAL